MRTRDGLIANGFEDDDHLWAPHVLRGALEGVVTETFTDAEVIGLVSQWLMSPVAQVDAPEEGALRAVVLPVGELPHEGDGLRYHAGKWTTAAGGGASGTATRETRTMNLDELLTVANKVVRLIIPEATSLVEVPWSFGIAPTGASFIITFTQGNRLVETVTFGAGVAGGVYELPDPRRIDAFSENGETLDINITQVGSTLAGHLLALGVTTDSSATPVDPPVIPEDPAFVFSSDGSTLDTSKWVALVDATGFAYAFEYPSTTSEKVIAPGGGSPGNYFQQIAILPNAQDVELTCQLDLTGKAPVNGAWWFGLYGRAVYAPEPDDAYVNAEILGIRWDGSNWTPKLGTDFVFGPTVATIPGANKFLRVRWRLQGDTSYGRVWVVGQPEPSVWGAQATIAVRAGRVGIGAEYEPGSGYAIVSDLRAVTL